MSDPACHGLELEKDEDGGSIDLPGSHWRLILRERKRSPIGSKRGVDREQRQGYSHESFDDICDALIKVLKSREDLAMHDPERRTQLLRRFSPSQLDLLERHPSDMKVDLTRIVDYVAKTLEKLGELISEAMGLAENETTRNQLESIRQRYERNRNPERQAKPPTSGLV